MNSAGPLITIITNTKNRASLISKCIRSIQNQTYQNYEHIIADGGNDNTEEVVKSFHDSKIIYIKVPVGGPSAQTKVAFDLSKGEYVTFLDDDDEYLPEKLEKQLQLIQSLPSDYGFIYGTMSYYDYVTDEYLYDHKAEVGGGEELLPLAISQPVVCGTPTLMFKRHVFASIGGTWISGIGKEMSDWALGCKALKQGWKVAPLKESYLKIYVNHDHVRMSNFGFYKNHAKHNIKFHSYFLSEYADIIQSNPKSAVTHYESLIINYIGAGNIRPAFSIWKKLIMVRPNLYSLLILPYCLILKFLKHEQYR